MNPHIILPLVFLFFPAILAYVVYRLQSEERAVEDIIEELQPDEEDK